MQTPSIPYHTLKMYQDQPKANRQAGNNMIAQRYFQKCVIGELSPRDGVLGPPQ